MLFILYETDTPPPVPLKKTPKPVVRDRIKCDLVYKMLLSLLVLFTPHRENLQARGLDDLAIHRGKFKSALIEEEAERIVKLLCEAFDLLGVPGFYKTSSGWKMVKVSSGFFIPVLEAV